MLGQRWNIPDIFRMAPQKLLTPTTASAMSSYIGDHEWRIKHVDSVPRLLTFANAVLAAASLGCFGVFFYFFYFYSWSQQWQFTDYGSQVVRYLAPIVLALVLSAALRQRPSRRISTAMFVLSLAISIYCANLVLGIDVAFPPRNFDRRTPLKVVGDLRNTD